MAKQSLNLPYLVLAGVVVAAMLVALLLVRPQIAELQETQGDLKSARVKLTEQQNFLRTLDQKKAQLELQTRHAAELDVALPVEKAMPDVLRIVNEGAKASGLVVSNISDISKSVQATARTARLRGQDKGSLPAKVMPLGISVKVVGSYQGLRLLLQNLERAGRLIDVITVSVRRPSVEDVEIINADLELLFYQFEIKQDTEEK